MSDALDLTQEFIDRAENGEVGDRLVSETDDLRVWHIHAKPGARLKVHTHVLDYFCTVQARPATIRPTEPTSTWRTKRVTPNISNSQRGNGCPTVWRTSGRRISFSPRLSLRSLRMHHCPLAVPNSERSTA